MSKEVIREDEDACLQYEIHNGNIFIHCDVVGWSLSKYKKMIAEWSEVLDEMERMGVVKVFSLSPHEQSAKYASMFGFTPVADVWVGDEVHILLEREV